MTPYQQRKAIAAEIVRERTAANEAMLASVVDRDPCKRCGVRGDIGCEHQPRDETAQVFRAQDDVHPWSFASVQTGGEAVRRTPPDAASRAYSRAANRAAVPLRDCGSTSEAPERAAGRVSPGLPLSRGGKNDSGGREKPGNADRGIHPSPRAIPSSFPRRRSSDYLVPVIHCHGTQADEAFQRHTALIKAERQSPALGVDPRFQALRSEAWAAFQRAFEVV